MLGDLADLEGRRQGGMVGLPRGVTGLRSVPWARVEPRPARPSPNAPMNPLLFFFRATATCAGLLAANLIFAQGGGGDSTPPQPQTPGYHEPGPGVTIKENMVSADDRKFVEEAAKSGMHEVAVAEAVTPRLQSAGVRELASQIAKDHRAANAELTLLSRKKAIALPSATEVEKKAENWREKTKDVDADYVKDVISGHKKSVKAFEKAEASKDPEIAAFARKTLPLLRDHLSRAQALEQGR